MLEPTTRISNGAVTARERGRGRPAPPGCRARGPACPARPPGTPPEPQPPLRPGDQTETAAELRAAWDADPRWDGIERTFSADDVVRLRGSVREEATLARWLAAQEREHRFLLYEADLRPSAWAARCLRQSDHVVVLADGGAAPPDGGPVPVLGDETRRRTSLVLLHGGGAVERACADQR